MRKIFNLLESIEGWVCILSFMVMVFAAFLQVLNRNIFHFPIAWTEELARYSMVWMALLGTQIALREGKQMSVEFFTNLFNKSIQKLFYIIGDLLCFAFAGITFWFSIDLLKMQLDARQFSVAMKIPMTFMYSILTISFFVMAVSRLYSAISYVRYGLEAKSRFDETGVEGGKIND